MNIEPVRIRWVVKTIAISITIIGVSIVLSLHGYQAYLLSQIGHATTTTSSENR